MMFAVTLAVLGDVPAGDAPLWFGVPASVSAVGMTAVVAGAILAIAMLVTRRKS